MDKFEITGNCTYCGQGKIIESTTPVSAERADLNVTNGCGCIGATTHRQLENALIKIEELVGKQCEQFKFVAVTEEQMEILKAAAKAMAYDEILNVTYSFGYGVKAKISKNAKDEIEIVRTNTNVIKRTT